MAYIHAPPRMHNARFRMAILSQGGNTCLISRSANWLKLPTSPTVAQLLRMHRPYLGEISVGKEEPSPQEPVSSPARDALHPSYYILRDQ